MIWDEIRRILAGAEEASRQAAQKSSATGEKNDQEISAELATAEQTVPGARSLEGAVRVEPAEPREDEAMTITYQGVLAQRGAAGIVLHCGYGPGPWRGVQDIPMTPRGFRVWQASVVPEQAGPFCFCFRDTAGHWDNRDGRDWVVQVQPARSGTSR